MSASGGGRSTCAAQPADLRFFDAKTACTRLFQMACATPEGSNCSACLGLSCGQSLQEQERTKILAVVRLSGLCGAYPYKMSPVRAPMWSVTVALPNGEHPGYPLFWSLFRLSPNLLQGAPTRCLQGAGPGGVESGRANVSADEVSSWLFAIGTGASHHVWVCLHCTRNSQ